MEHRRQVLRLGTAVIMLAVAVRLLSAGFLGPFVELIQKPDVVSLFLYLETGRVVRFSWSDPVEPVETEAPKALQETQAEIQPSQEETVLSFSSQDLELVQVQYHCNYRPDLAALLAQPLGWDLRDGEPAVLILHTHATETYTGDDIDYSGSYRTLDEKQNMLAIGAEIARVLEEGGITVLHDKTLHDYPNYNSAYSNARDTIQSYLEQYPTIRMVLDIHRDASASTSGQLVTSATAGGQSSAQLMMVVGTKSADWEADLSLALKLTALLEQENPGICRPVDLRSARFNMDLSAGSLLVEVGAAGNTRQEAIIAANALAQSILEIANGTG